MKVIDGGIQRKYYKYGTTLNSAITQVGGTYTNGVFTGASGAHLLLPVLPITTANNWEIQTVYTYNGGGTYPTVIAPSTSGYGIQWIVLNGAYYISLSRNGAESLIVSLTTGISAVAGVPYYFKLGFTGTKYYLSYNTDGSDNYTEAWSYSSTEKVYTEVAHYLMDWGVGSNRWSAGSINMPKTKIYINGDLYLAGTQPEPATESDYDFYKDVEVREVVELTSAWQEWTQPVLTNNGTVGGYSFAVVASGEEQYSSNPYRAYEAFDNDASTYWRSNGGSGAKWLEFYNPVPLKVTNLQYVPWYNYPTEGNVQGSSNGTDWTTITTWTNSSASSFNIDLSTNTNAYKYYRINITNTSDGTSANIHCTQLNITAQYLAQKFGAVRN